MATTPRLIVGLGNPGIQYRGTRHNVGFEIVNRLAVRLKAPLRRRAFHGRVGVAQRAGEGVTLLLPTTYMNLSGIAVAEAAGSMKLRVDEILVVCDDLDLELGRLRIRKQGSSGGHNGLRSIIEQLQTESFARLRIGIGRPGDGSSVVDYVLGVFHHHERPLVDAVVNRAVEACESALRQGIDEAMNQFNTTQE